MELWIDNDYGRKWWDGRLEGFFANSERSDQIVPAADVIEDADGYQFSFEVPGVTSESIDVRVEDGNLVVEAERKQPQWAKGTEVHRTERMYGKIYRSFALPEDASHDDVHAAYRDGVLEVEVGKRPESKPVRVKVEHEN